MEKREIERGSAGQTRPASTARGFGLLGRVLPVLGKVPRCDATPGASSMGYMRNDRFIHEPFPKPNLHNTSNGNSNGNNNDNNNNNDEKHRKVYQVPAITGENS